MAKNDQKILKFLNKNKDLAPTITDMMNQLNISIADISDSLAELSAHGLVSKRHNKDGIECWFVGSAPAAPTSPSSYPPEKREPMAAPSTIAMNPIPNNPPPPPKSHPIQTPTNPAQSLPSMPVYANSAKGIGFLTFALGLVIAVAFSTWLGLRLTHNELGHATRNFVDQKSFDAAGLASKEFEEKTKAHITALEEQVKQLNDQLVTTKAVADSVKPAAVAVPEKESKVAPPKTKKPAVKGKKPAP